MIFTTEVFFEAAIESWSDWDWNPRPLSLNDHYIVNEKILPGPVVISKWFPRYNILHWFPHEITDFLAIAGVKPFQYCSG